MLRGSALCILPSDSGFADEQTKCNSLRLRIRAGATRSACNPLAALAGQRTPNPKRRFGPQSSPTPGRRKPEETALGSAERGAPFWTNARIPSLAGRSAFDRNCGARDLHRTLRGSAGRLAWTGAQADLDGRPHHPRQDIEARKPLPARVRISSKVSQSQNCTPNNSRPPIKRREPIVPDGLPRRRAASGQAHTVCVFDGLGWRP